MSNYQWLFRFPLPVFQASELSAKSQAHFEKQLRQHGVTAARVLYHSFQEVFDEGDCEANGVQLALAAMNPAGAMSDNGTGAAEGSLEAPLLGDMEGLSVGDVSLAQAQQCTIEIFLATLRSLDACFRKAIAERQETAQDLGAQIRLDVYPDLKCKRLLVEVSLAAEAAEFLAESAAYPVQLSAEGVARLGRQADLCKGHAPAHVKYARKIRDYCQHYEERISHRKVVLKNVDLVRLFHDKITDLVDFAELKRFGLFHDMTPLHNVIDLKPIAGTFTLWFMNICPKNWHGVEELHQYFGEEVGVYFLFLQELTWFVLYLSVLAVPALILPAAADTIHFVFSALIMVWFRIFTLHWLRKELQYAAFWGARLHRLSKLKEHPNLRLSGEQVEDSDDGRRRQIRRRGLMRQVLGIICSALLTMLFVLALLCLVAAEHYAYGRLSDAHQDNRIWQQLLSTGLGVVTGIQIKVMDAVWDKVSDRITDLECRQTEARFLASKRLKASIVKFITSMTTLLYFAFVLPATTARKDPLIFQQQLSNQLMSVFFTRYILLGSLNRIVKSYVSLLFKRRARSQFQLSFVETQMLMEKYGSKDINDDFLDVLLPLCMVVMFGMISPAVVFLLFISAASQFRSDAWKLSHTYRRPFPQVVAHIGFFNDFLEVIGRIMIFTHFGVAYVLFGKDWLRSVSFATGDQTGQGDQAYVLAMTIVVSLLWSYIGWLVPVKTEFARCEERRHDLQRRRLYELNDHSTKQLGLKLSAAGLARTTDFAQLPRPAVSRTTHSFHKGVLHLE
mmetsp:Transcript_102473/g.298903  ORF Transcript_102473/g.298903 Transcript_102473/m.298903 type:complete len:788 (-) Transcript_102473:192-2555(-)